MSAARAGRAAGAAAVDRPAGNGCAASSGSTIALAECLAYLRALPSGIAALAYVDPPFNTGRRQERRQLATARDDGGDRTGFQGRRYRTRELGRAGFDDEFDDYPAFLAPRLREVWRLLADDGSLFVHLDCREVHHVKVMLDEMVGRERFVNEIIWAYDYGARTRTRWPRKHDNILWYARDPERYAFAYGAVDRIPYLAPRLVTPEKARRGKTPTDVWWQTIVSPTGREKTGYPTQKPLAVLERIVKVHSRRGDLVLDCFAGSGTTGEAAAKHGRRFLLVDESPAAAAVMRKRLERFGPRFVDARVGARAGASDAPRTAGAAGADQRAMCSASAPRAASIPPSSSSGIPAASVTLSRPRGSSPGPR